MAATTRYTHAGLTDRGRVRANNEDRWAADAELGLYVVADGIGGHTGGERSAEAVVRTLPRLVRKHVAKGADLTRPEAAEGLHAALTDLSDRVFEESRRHARKPGAMGATVVAALVRGEHALVAHMGDSRAYRLRRGGGRAREELEVLTRDHSLAQVLDDAGQLAPGEKDHRGRSVSGVIIRHVGMPGEPLPDVRLVDLSPGDRLLLCTDGLCGMIDDARIGELLGRAAPPQDICRDLVDSANEAGGTDNIAVVVVDVAPR